VVIIASATKPVKAGIGRHDRAMVSPHAPRRLAREPGANGRIHLGADQGQWVQTTDEVHSQRAEQNSIRNIQKRAEKAESQYLPVGVTGRAQEVVTGSHPEES